MSSARDQALQLAVGCALRPMCCSLIPNSPGSTTGACTREESFAAIAKAINRVHEEVPEVICVIENMVGIVPTLLPSYFPILLSVSSFRSFLSLHSAPQPSSRYLFHAFDFAPGIPLRSLKSSRSSGKRSQSKRHRNHLPRPILHNQPRQRQIPCQDMSRHMPPLRCGIRSTYTGESRRGVEEV